MATRVLLTIDTEITWRHHVAGRSPEDCFRRSIEPAAVGLTHQLAVLARHGLKATFFVDPMPARLWGLDPIRRIVDRVLAAGQEVQLHLHPNWTGARAGDGGAAHGPFELGDLPGAEQRALIEEARSLLIAAGAPSPIAFRAGGYAADDETLRALAALGFTHDSSHNGSHAPWPSRITLPRDEIGPVLRHGIIELPVSQLREGGGRLRHLQLCAISAGEMRGALDHAAAANQFATVIVSHSFELASRDGSRPNRIVAARFDTLCDHLAAERTRMPTRHFVDLPLLELSERSLYRSPRHHRLGRAIGQALSNLEHRRRA